MSLSYTPQASEPSNLLTANRFEFNTYLATVSWHDRLRLVTVLESDSVPLLGTSLLWGNRVTLDVLEDGT